MPSILSSDQSKLSIVLALTGATAIAGYTYWYYKKHLAELEENEPKYWRKVGELTDLYCYPIKSCAPVRLNEVECSKLGLQSFFLRDRTFMVVNTKNEFVTGRQYPKLVLVCPEIKGNIMILSAAGMRDTELIIEHLYTLSTIQCNVWGQIVNAVDCGDKAALWLSRFILSEEIGLRLVFYPKDLSTRAVRPKNEVFDTMKAEDTGAFHDATSFMLFNESSLIDLNTKLENPVGVLNFRPNFVVRGALPYEEDYWKWIKIGDTVVFRNVKPCTRCIFTNINPETAARSSDGNPLNVLKSYRKFPKTGDSPVLGTHLGLRTPGKISIGDFVYVECNY